MQLDKDTRLKEQKRLINIILGVTAFVLIVSGFFFKDEKTGNLIRTLGWGFILATIIFNSFKSKIGYKPTREEMEEKMFGNNKSTVEK